MNHDRRLRQQTQDKQEDGKPLFRITVWPGTSVPVPHVGVPETLGYFDDTVMGFSGWSRPVELPLELYLRPLHELDLADLDAIRSFSQQYGPIALPDLTEVSPVDQRFTMAPRIEVVEEMRERAVAAAPNGWRHGGRHRGYLLLDEFRLHVRLLRDLTRIWQAFREGNGYLSVIEQWESAEFGIADDVRMWTQDSRLHPERYGPRPTTVSGPEPELLSFLAEHLESCSSPLPCGSRSGLNRRERAHHHVPADRGAHPVRGAVSAACEPHSGGCDVPTLCQRDVSEAVRASDRPS